MVERRKTGRKEEGRKRKEEGREGRKKLTAVWKSAQPTPCKSASSKFPPWSPSVPSTTPRASVTAWTPSRECGWSSLIEKEAADGEAADGESAVEREGAAVKDV